MTIDELIREIRRDNLHENSDLIAQYDSVPQTSKAEIDLEEDLFGLTQKAAGSLTVADLEQMTGFSPDEQASLKTSREEQIQKSKKKLSDFLPVAKRASFQGMEKKAFQYLIDVSIRLRIWKRRLRQQSK